MTTQCSIRKVFQGVATRRDMFCLFDRHAQRPNRWYDDAAALYAGEWFEVRKFKHDGMFELLPPLWIRSTMFAMREYLTGWRWHTMLGWRGPAGNWPRSCRIQ